MSKDHFEIPVLTCVNKVADKSIEKRVDKVDKVVVKSVVKVGDYSKKQRDNNVNETVKESDIIMFCKKDRFVRMTKKPSKEFCWKSGKLKDNLTGMT